VRVAGRAIMRVWCHIPSGGVISDHVRRRSAPVCCVAGEDCNREEEIEFRVGSAVVSPIRRVLKDCEQRQCACAEHDDLVCLNKLIGQILRE